ncbi:hypothetical protein EDB19DRAFT_1692072 [Suillus lakei]|nr:hypothetical protein EDB19DRAFT_1692072 [Suillus lakei]
MDGILARRRGWEYMIIALDHNINAQVKGVASVHEMMDVRTLEILLTNNRETNHLD